MLKVMRTIRRLPAAVAVQTVCAALMLHSGGAAAISLTQAYEAALQNDPTYRGAVFENEAGKEYTTIGRSGLLPNLSASYTRSKNRADIESPDILGRTTLKQPVYNSKAATVQLRQTVFNLDALARYKQGIAQSASSAAQFDTRGQELVMRVAGAYIDALYAAEQLRLANAQRDTYIEQRKVNDRLFKGGEGTRTDMIETQARLDVAEAQVIESADNEATARTALSALVGSEVTSLDQLGPQFRIAPLPEGGFEAWKKIALANNPELQARVYSVEAARQEINKARAGHAPRLDFIASYSKNDAETINTYNQVSTVRAIGFQVTVPLYQGGYVSAVSRQTVAGYEKAKTDLQAQTDKVLIDLRKQYNAVLSGVARMAALEKSVASGKLLMTATEQSIKGGVRINLDLLNAQQQLYVSERDQAQARYNYLLALLRLRAAAGTLSPDDVREVSNYFH